MQQSARIAVPEKPTKKQNTFDFINMNSRNYAMIDFLDFI